jgi:hypothetical protein
MAVRLATVATDRRGYGLMAVRVSAGRRGYSLMAVKVAAGSLLLELPHVGVVYLSWLAEGRKGTLMAVKVAAGGRGCDFMAVWIARWRNVFVVWAFRVVVGGSVKANWRQGG